MSEREMLPDWPVFHECLFCGFRSENPGDFKNHRQPIKQEFPRAQKVMFSVRDRNVVTGFVTGTKHRQNENGHELIYQIATIQNVSDLELAGVKVLDKHHIEVEASAEILYGFPLPADFKTKEGW